MIPADLHMHSHYSNDGEFSVATLVEKCRQQRVNTFSITDHNSARANKEAVELVRQEGMRYIPGIEIDCIYEGINLHVLGYNIDWQSPAFTKLEEDVFAKVMQSFSQMIENTTALGFKIDKDAVLEYAGDTLPSPEMIAEIMLSDPKYYSPLLEPYMEGGARSDMPYINFYLDYFAQGKPAFVPVEYISFDQAIGLIKGNGGTPIVAHPGLNLKGRENIVEQLLDKGAEGLEAFNNYHDMEQIGYFASVVQKRKAIITCGSDFHGKTKPLIHIGGFKYDNRFEAYLNSSIEQLTV